MESTVVCCALLNSAGQYCVLLGSFGQLCEVLNIDGKYWIEI